MQRAVKLWSPMLTPELPSMVRKVLSVLFPISSLLEVKPKTTTGREHSLNYANSMRAETGWESVPVEDIMRLLFG
jgi:hypothetical protein